MELQLNAAEVITWPFNEVGALLSGLFYEKP